MVVQTQANGLFIALLTVTVALAGCADKDIDETPVPDLGNMTAEPEEPVFEWPECHLESGTIDWPSVPAVPAPGAPTEATLKTDAYGVTHIYADDLYTLFFANGYIQARDRLVQMDILRTVGYGESAKYYGEGQLGLDFEVRRELYTREEIEQQWQNAPEEGKQVLQAYADGVNRFMEEAALHDNWPAEFAAVSRVPEPWQPQDSVALINYLIGFFGSGGGQELNNLRRVAQLESTLGEDAAWDAFEDLVWLRADDTYTSIHPDDKILNGCEDPLPRSQVDHQLAFKDAANDVETFGGIGGYGTGVGSLPGGGPNDTAFPPSPGSYFADIDRGLLKGYKWGSNAFLADGSITSTGVPIMWGAPQMGYYKPPVPYQVGLHAPAAGFDAVGMGVAGAPGIVIGRNAHIAWTATSGIEDQTDLVELTLVDARSYLWDNETRAMDCWTAEHEVYPGAGTQQQEPRVYDQEICRAEGWPVVGINEEAGVAYLKKSTTRNEELMGALKWLQAPTTTSIDGFRALMADFPFTFNYFIASGDGVAQVHTGDVPLRAEGYDPRLPTPAGSAYEWTGEAYTEQMQTWITDPSRGYIANWNNAPVYGWRAGDQDSLWGPVQRVQQIEYWTQEKLREDGTLSFEDIQDINWLAATHDSHALPFMPHLIEAAATDPDLADIGAELDVWFRLGAPWRDDDGDGLYDDPAHAIWDFMMQDMFTRLTGDELGNLSTEVDLEPDASENNADHGTLNNGQGVILKILQGTTKHDWCDDITTSGTETCDDQLVAGLRAAQAALTEEYGSPDVATWLHPVHTSKFLSFGAAVADERPMVNRGSYVQVVSMAESERSVNVLPPGNSGFISTAELAIMQGGGDEPERLHRELDLYWGNQYKPFPLTQAEVDAVAIQEQTLVVVEPLSRPV